MDKINSLNQKYSRARAEDKQEISMTSTVMTNKTRNRYRISFSGRIQCEQDYIDKPRYEQKYRNDFRRGSFRCNLRMNQNFRDQNYRDRYRKTIGMIEVGVCLEKDNIRAILEGMIEVAVVDLDQVQEQVQS